MTYRELTIWRLEEDNQCGNNLKVLQDISDKFEVKVLDENNLPLGTNNVFMFRYSPFFQFGQDGSILIPNSRPFVWPTNYIWSNRFLELLKRLQDRKVTIVLDYLWEAETTVHDSTTLFLQRAIQFGIDTSKLILATNNGLNLGLRDGYIKTYRIKKLNIPWWLIKTHHEFQYVQKVDTGKNRIQLDTSKDILCLNRRVRTNKLLALYELDKANLLSKTRFSLVWFHSNTLQYLQSSECLPQVKAFLEKLGVDYLDHTPIQPSNDALYGEEIRSDEYLFFSRPEWYLDSKISCITETFYYDFDPLFPYNDYHDTKVHLTEKTWKALYFGHPFVMVGEVKSLEVMRKLGFQTFGSIINESYDNLPDRTRMKEAIGQIPILLENYNSPSIQEIKEFNQNLIKNNKHIRDLANKFLVSSLLNATSFL